MTERAHIPSSAACGQWETLLADALDGLLRPEDEATFTSHMSACAACTALFDEARRGREWLDFLSVEPEAPEGLVDRILAITGPGHKGQPAFATAGGAGIAAIPAWQRPGFMGQVRRWAEPRLMMTVAMAFFSIALTLNLAGVRVTQLRFSDLRPAAVRSYVERRATMASVPFVRYYDHLRFVYEVQSRVREFRDEGEDAQPQQSTPAAPGESRRNQKGGGSRMQTPDPDQLGNFLQAAQNANAEGRTTADPLRQAQGTLSTARFGKTVAAANFTQDDSAVGGWLQNGKEGSRVWTA